jgi:hypothetical protein
VALLLLLVVVVQVVCWRASPTQQQGMQAAAVAVCSMGRGTKRRATRLLGTGQDWDHMLGVHATQVWQAVHLHMPYATPQQAPLALSSTATCMVHTAVMLC